MPTWYIFDADLGLQLEIAESGRLFSLLPTRSMRFSEDSFPPEQDDMKQPLLDPECPHPLSLRPDKSSWLSHSRRHWTLGGAGAALLLLGIAIGGASSQYFDYPASRTLSLLLTSNETRAALASAEALPDSLAANRRLSEVS